MARLPRLAVAGQLHVVTHRTRGGEPAFVDAADCSVYLVALREASAAHRVAVHAYALLPAELRLLATPETVHSLSRMVQSTGRRFVAAYNRRHSRSGALWDGRFKASVVDAQSYFLACLRYVEATQATSWSSASHHSGNRVDPLVVEHPLFWNLGNTPFEREAAYRKLTEQALTAVQADEIEQAVQFGWALGSAKFIAALAAQTPRRLERLPRGRPANQG